MWLPFINAVRISNEHELTLDPIHKIELIFQIKIIDRPIIEFIFTVNTTSRPAIDAKLIQFASETVVVLSKYSMRLVPICTIYNQFTFVPVSLPKICTVDRTSH